MLLEALQVLLAPLMKPVSVLIGVISLLQSLAATCSGPTSTVRPLHAFLTLRGAPSLLAETLSAFISLCRMLTALAVEGCKLHFSNLHKAEQAITAFCR